MIQSVPNTLSPYYMGSFDIEIIHAKLLNYLQKKGDKVVSRRITLYCSGKTINFNLNNNLLIEDLKKENAIIDDGQTVAITSIGKKLLQDNKHLLQRAKHKKYKRYKNTKVRWNKDVPTEEDFRILDLLKAKTIDDSFTITEFARELGMNRPLATYRMKRLKKAKLIDYEPRKYSTVKILKDIES